MKNNVMRKIVVTVLSLVTVLTLTACSMADYSTSAVSQDKTIQKQVTENLVEKQPTPRDIDFSLERYNLIKRAYWVNGQREKANAVPCEVKRPIGYIQLWSYGNVVGTYAVDGKVSSLNSYLTPDSDYYEYSAGEYSAKNYWLADVDGSYGSNDNGIFFFTPSGHYVEWTGEYIYSDSFFIGYEAIE